MADASNSTSTTVPPTELIHLTYDGNFQLDCEARVVSCRTVVMESANPDATTTVELALDRTTMHPQGGGQPTDIGTITIITHGTDDSNNNEQQQQQSTIHVDKVTINRDTGVVTHFGKSNSTTITTGDLVHVAVDEATRTLLSECHTAGHVVDSAMAKCDQVLPASKGYHFLDGPYVEYRGRIPPKDRPALLEQLKQAFAELVEQDIQTKIESMSRKDAEAQCPNFDLSLFAKDEGEPLRIVTVAGWHCPCGGTHVRSTKDLKERQWGITGIKCKKDVVRIKYGYSASCLALELATRAGAAELPLKS